MSTETQHVAYGPDGELLKPRLVILETPPADGWTARVAAPIVHAPPQTPEKVVFPLLKKIFTWWNSATPGILFTIARNATLVGSDEFGNRYFECRTNKESYDSRKRRYVLYRGYAEPSKVPAEWHGWLHYTFDEPPTRAPLKRQKYELEHLPNLTGTLYAWRPKGAISRGGDRAHASGDYQAWTPGEDA